MRVAVESYGITDVGQKREKNEDQFLMAELHGSMQVHQTSVAIEDCSTIFGETQGHLLLVADGVGGHAAGERASALTISTVAAYALSSLQWVTSCEECDDISDQLKRIAANCQQRLITSAREHPNERGMATTITLGIVIWPKLYVMHIGDSRCYVLRDGELMRLTRDHTLGQLYAEFAEEKRSEKKAASRGASHVLWNVVSSDGEAPPVPDIVTKELRTGDQIVLCTDGLTGHIADVEIAKIVADSASVNEACDKLVTEANSRGGSDNITVVLSRVSPTDRNDDAAMVETRVPLESVIGTSEPKVNLSDTDEFIPAELNNLTEGRR